MDAQKNTEIIERIKYLMREMGMKQVQFAQRRIGLFIVMGPELAIFTDMCHNSNFY